LGSASTILLASPMWSLSSMPLSTVIHRVDTHHVVEACHCVLIMVLPSGHASLRKLWECTVATFTLCFSFTHMANAMTVTSSASMHEKTALVVLHGLWSLKEPYTLVTVQFKLPALQCTGSLRGGWIDEPVAEHPWEEKQEC
jgi:hypothetical protein